MIIQVDKHAQNGTNLRDQDGFYTWGEQKFPSVTTILKVVGKPALLFWAANSVAKAACDAWDVAAEERYTRDCAFPDYDTLRNAPWNERDAKADIGTATHDVLERVGRGEQVDLGTYDPAVRPYAESALAWIEESKPKFLCTERACFNNAVGYAGTCDAFIELDGRVLVLDYKTSKQTYEDHALQLAAYRHALWMAGDNGEKLAVPYADGGAILVVQPGRSRLYEWECGFAEYEVFCQLKTLFDWKHASPKPTLLNKKKRGVK